MAKALGNGVPIGACWARADVAGVFEPGDHATTYGGQPLATAAARAVLAMMEAEDVPARAAAAGARLTERARRPCPGWPSVRGSGLLLGVELDGRDARAVNADLLDAGVVANAVTPTALRLAPSLLIGDDEIDEAVAIIGDVLAAALTGGDVVTVRHLLEIDDLTPAELDEVLRRGRRPARRAAAGRPHGRACTSRSRRCAPATRARWRSSSSAAIR